MKVVVAGGHGKIARILLRLLARRGDDGVGIIRNPDQAADLTAVGATPVVLDLEHTRLDDLSDSLAGADAVVFAAGAGPGSGVQRKYTVDQSAAELCAAAAESAGVLRFLQVSAMGTDHPPQGDDVFSHYLRAKSAAEEDLRNSGLDYVILRPGRLTDDPGTGRVELARHVDRGSVSRSDVATVLVGLLDRPGITRRTLELVGGDEPVDRALDDLVP